MRRSWFFGVNVFGIDATLESMEIAKESINDFKTLTAEDMEKIYEMCL